MDIETLLPEEARQLRDYFRREQIVHNKMENEVHYEVDAKDVTILSTNSSRRVNPEGIVLAMSAQGVVLKFPASRQLLKRLKREYEQEENWRRRKTGGETKHGFQISQHNRIYGTE